jgi:hypothetical protein
LVTQGMVTVVGDVGRDKVGVMRWGCGKGVFVASITRVEAAMTDSACAPGGATVAVGGIGAGRAAFFLRTPCNALRESLCCS